MMPLPIHLKQGRTSSILAYFLALLEERGYGDILLWRYPSLRNYFAEFIQLPFAVKSGTEPLRNAINLVRQLDAGILKKIPDNALTAFIPKELRRYTKIKTVI
jgi:hypothetical protein